MADGFKNTWTLQQVIRNLNGSYANWDTAYSWGDHAGLYAPINELPNGTTVQNSLGSTQLYFNDDADTLRWRIGVTGAPGDDFIMYDNDGAAVVWTVDDSTNLMTIFKGLSVVGGVTLPGTTGNGIKVSTAFGWHDIIGTPQYPLTGAGRPAFSQIGTTGIYAWNFSTGDEQFYIWHMPHDYVPGTDIHFHVHWFGSQTAGGFARWQFDYIYASGHNTDAYASGSATSVYAQEAQSTTAYQHMITETAAVTISGLEVDGVILCRVDRVAAVGETDVSGAVFAPIVDIHYQSTNVSTPNKSPNFYTT